MEGENMTGAFRLGARLACAVAVAWIGVAGLPATSMVPDTPPDATFVFPAGGACPNFDLQVEVWANPNAVFREFKDQNGHVVRTLTAGKGNTLLFTNLSNGQKLATRANGSVTHVTLNPDGSSTNELTGHNVLILFPTDIPAGPTTTLYVGRVVFTSDAFANFTLQSATANSTDICAAVSQ
jgi:hypothetical protein